MVKGLIRRNILILLLLGIIHVSKTCVRPCDLTPVPNCRTAHMINANEVPNNNDNQGNSFYCSYYLVTHYVHNLHYHIINFLIFIYTNTGRSLAGFGKNPNSPKGYKNFGEDFVVTDDKIAGRAISNTFALNPTECKVKCDQNKRCNNFVFCKVGMDNKNLHCILRPNKLTKNNQKDAKEGKNDNQICTHYYKKK